MSKQGDKNFVAGTPSGETRFSQISLHADHSLLKSGLMSPPCLPGALGKVGRFTVLRVLGTGGMGVVALGRDPESGKDVGD